MALFGKAKSGVDPSARRDGDLPVDLLVVGLGNPGSKYAGTRHNVGADAVADLATRHGANLKTGSDHAQVAVLRIDDRKVVLAIPATYMNESGRAVAPLVRRYSIGDDLSRLLVIHDELDLEPGRLRLKLGGGLAGHNGLRSIRDHLGSPDFSRLRIGIGKPGGAKSGTDHVLGKVPSDQRGLLEAAIGSAADAVEQIVEFGLQATMQKVNTG